MTKTYELSDKILDSLFADDMGLYEVFWEVDDGDIYDEYFKLKKSNAWSDVKEKLNSIIDQNDLQIYMVDNGKKIERVVDFKKITEIKQNWKPFNMNSEKGYVISLK
jgi:hypothetical protein